MRWLCDGRIWLTIALTFNAALVTAHFYLRSRAAELRPMPLGSRLPIPAGRTLDGVEVTPQALSSRPCHLIRYASERCGHCKRDLDIYQRLEKTLLEKGCDSLMLAPTDDAFPQSLDATRTEVAYPVLAFAESTPLSATPTTMVTTRDWVVLWSRVGAMEPSDVEDAVRAFAIPGRRDSAKVGDTIRLCDDWEAEKLILLQSRYCQL